MSLEKERFGVFGTTEDGRKTIRYRRELNHPAEKVWRAITEQSELAAWFPELELEHATGERIQNSVACGWHYKIDAMEMSLEGIEFELEGFAGPTLTSIYFEYRKLYGAEDVHA